uniref:Reverse transcriptase domain-containing protein n=1 Tax=Tanacetum cinerariifolium TaxID=118510 RepID=A0A6L2LIT6_TANCI|nr:hypothetical protein [Tanacetum cinerariifolium]
MVLNPCDDLGSLVMKSIVMLSHFHTHELTLMCPDLVPNEKKKIERYIRGFPEIIKGNITSSRPTTLHEAINMARELVEQAVQAPTEGKVYAGKLPKCNRCNLHHNGQCTPKCQRCQKMGHQEIDCRVRLPDAGENYLQNNEGACARAYAMRTENPHQNPNVVTGTFLVNDHSACILFDSGAEKSFVSTEFTPFIDIAPATLDSSYDVELADGKVVSANTVLRGYTLALFYYVFKIDLLPTRLGNFDVIVRMDWLSNHHAVIVCYEKVVRIPLRIRRY